MSAPKQGDRVRVTFEAEFRLNATELSLIYFEREGRTYAIPAADATVEVIAPAEPTGLGAVVEDAEGFHWVRIGERDWYCEPRGNKFYGHIDAVRVLSAGVSS